MKKLPFKTQPKTQTTVIGNDEIGTIELPVLKGLKVGEQLLVDEVNKNIPNAFADASRLAVKIDSELKFDDLLFAFDIVASPDWESSEKEEVERLVAAKELGQREAKAKIAEIEAKAKVFRSARIRYAPDILNLNNRSEEASYLKQLAAVTAIIQHRLDDSWTDEDTKGISDALFQEIWKFAQSEMGIESDPTEETELTPEKVGKQPEETTNPPRSTGEKSTGESPATGQTTIVSVESDSLIAPVG